MNGIKCLGSRLRKMENANLMNVSYPGNIAHYQVPKMVYCSKVNGVPQ